MRWDDKQRLFDIILNLRQRLQVQRIVLNAVAESRPPFGVISRQIQNFTLASHTSCHIV